MRKENWPELLNEYLIAIKDKQFEWGVFDCCIFISDGILALTGEDPMEEFRGLYGTKEESDDVLKTVGNGNLLRTLIRKFGRPVNGVKGQRGDLAMHKEGQLGMILGRQAIFLVEDGFGLALLTDVKYAFRVV